MDYLTFFCVVTFIATLGAIAAFAIHTADKAVKNYLEHNGAARELARAQMNANLALQTRGAGNVQSDKMKGILDNGI